MLDQRIRTVWTRVSFGDVVRLSKARVADPAATGIERVIGLEHIDPGDLRIRRWGNVADGTTFTSVFKPGQVLFGKRRAYQRKVAMPDFVGVCSGDIYVLESANNGLLPELLPFLCQTDAFFDHAVGTSAGSLSPRTNWSSLASFEFLLPPIQRQQELVRLLAATEQLREAYRSAQLHLEALLTAFGQSILRDNAGCMRKVGELAKFTSGKQIPTSSLPSSPTKGSNIPVYGGNGVSGFTDTPLKDCLSPTVVIGRVGQYCGTALMTRGPSWVTDNALYPKSVDRSLDVKFLYICLHARQLNRGKLGEYLPLITQTVVHEAEIPFIEIERQTELVEQHRRLELEHGNIIRRLNLANNLYNAACQQIFWRSE